MLPNTLREIVKVGKKVFLLLPNTLREIVKLGKKIIAAQYFKGDCKSWKKVFYCCPIL
jgi:hypothetical protein